MSIEQSILQKIIVDRIEIVKRVTLVERDIHIEDKMPVVLTGIRRSGKSYLLYQIMYKLIEQGHTWNEFLYINFEDERLIGFDVSDFNSLLDVFHYMSDKEPILFLDEIQNIQGWEKFARRIADEKRMVYITGSNASVLNKEIEATLGGRYLVKRVYPYNFIEFLRAKAFQWNRRSLSSSKEQGQLLNLFDEYMKYGGFPEVLNLINKRDYLSSIYSKIFLGDVIARYLVGNVKALEVLMKKIAESIRQPISYSRLTNMVKSIGITVSKTTIIQYIDYLKDAYLIYHIDNYSSKIVDRTTNPKYYFIDTGLVNLFLFESDPALLENLVASELVRKYGNENIYFYQDNNLEIDFYIPEQSIAIQVCYSMRDSDTRTREIEALKRFNQFKSMKNNIILSYNHKEETIVDEGIEIRVIPVYRWLLENSEYID